MVGRDHPILRLLRLFVANNPTLSGLLRIDFGFRRREPPSPPTLTPILLRLVFWLWLIGALLVGHFQLLTRLPPPAVQGVLVFLTALLLLAYQRLEGVRAWVDALDFRALVGLHLSRFVGIYFLLLYQRGLLPYDFAVRGGLGDIVVAVGALLFCLWPLGVEKRRRALTVWNVVGSIDILLVVSTAARHGLEGNPQMRLLAVLPLSLLPTFFVPLIIATHVIIFLRLRRLPPVA